MGQGRRTFLIATVVLPILACSSNDLGNDPRLTADPVDASAAAGPIVYVGEVDGNDMRVGLVVENGKGALFFCGGQNTLTSTKWFRGAVGKDSISLDKEGAAARGTFDAKKASGTVTFPMGAPLNWTVTRVPEGSVAGLYDAKDAGIAGVVIASEDFAQGAYIQTTPKQEYFQIIVIKPIRVVDSGLTVSYAGHQIVVKRARPQS